MDIICRVALGQRGTTYFDNPNVEIVKGVFANIGTQTIDKLSYLMPWEWPIWILRRLLESGIGNTPFSTLLKNLTKEVEERKKLRVIFLQKISNIFKN